MQTRNLGNADLQITPVGFGAWAIGGGGYEFAWGHQEDRDSVAAILRALELGVNWIDTAPVYGTGHSEEIVAQALQQWKGKKPYIFTKSRSAGTKIARYTRTIPPHQSEQNARTV